MITRLARRLGFQTSVPVSVVDEWLLPRHDAAQPLAPRGGTATCLVDEVGRVQPSHRTWTLDWTLKAGARWVSAIEAERVSQELIAPATIETTVETPAGTVVHRVAAAVVDGEPVAIVEIENQGGVAIAAGLVARPLVHGGRGFLGHAAVGDGALDLGEQGAVRFASPAATAVSDGVDLLGSMPAPDAGVSNDRVASRSGGAQAAAVFPIPHTATLRVVIELGESVRPNAAVPAIDDVQRGWARHLEAGARFDVGGTDVAERTAIAARGLLTSWPLPAHAPSAIVALAELGFCDDARRLFGDLEHLDDDTGIVTAIARWAQLGDATSQLDDLDRIIGPLARAAHGVSGPTLVGASWTAGAFRALADRLELIDQPDVAQMVRELKTRDGSTVELGDSLSAKTAPSSLADPHAGASAVRAVRHALVADGPDGVDLVAALPEHWRGRSIDVYAAPVEQGSISFGLRWHGPRPALLWQVERSASTPFEVTARTIDPDFASTDATGEVLLADPGWPQHG